MFLRVRLLRAATAKAAWVASLSPAVNAARAGWSARRHLTTGSSATGAAVVDPIPAADEKLVDVEAGTTNGAAVDVLLPSDGLEQLPSSLDAAATHALGDLDAAGVLSSFPNVSLVQESIEWVHVVCGLPWWGAIVASTLALRVALAPLFVSLQRNAAKMTVIQPELTALGDEMKAAKRQGDKMLELDIHLRMRTLLAKHDVRMGSMIIRPLLSAPIMASFFFAVQGMAEAGITSFESGGTLWFTNLSAPDPYYVLPLCASAAFAFIFEYGKSGASQMYATTETSRMMIRLASIIFIPIIAQLPAGLTLYFTTTNICSLVQHVAFLHPRIRRMLRLPPIPPQDISSRDLRSRGSSLSLKQCNDFLHAQKNKQPTNTAPILQQKLPR